MATVNLTGLQPVDFPNSQGQQIQGLKLHFTFKDPHVDGLAADSQFLSNALLDKLGVSFDVLRHHLDKPINLDYSPKGKIIDITAAD